MSENCDQNCGSCGEDCEQRTKEQENFTEKLNELSSVKKVIAVISGKGGVGKSMITSLLAVTMNRRGNKTAILDADVTGPSIPRAFGIKEKATGSELGLFPVTSKLGIDIMSINLLLQNDTDPVIWRGPILAGTVKQFWSDVIWNNVDIMFLDMPPGTGDVPLTVFQSIPVDGIIVVTSPQELVSMIVSKAVKMAEMMKIPIIGLVENMSYFKCPDNGKEYKIFGDSNIDEIAEKHHLTILAKLPINPKLAAACDRGMIELFDGNELDPVADIIEKIEARHLKSSGQDDEIQSNSDTKESEEKKMIKIAVASENEKVTEHFGHCLNFNIYEAENGRIVRGVSIPNPGHKPGYLPNFLNDMGVQVIISGGMGGGAVEIFNEKGIEVVTGAKGNAKEAATAYLDGKLKSTGSVCHEHQHHDECAE